MSYRSERFNASMRSLDVMASGRDVSKWALVSDGGAGVERMLDAIDGPVPDACAPGADDATTREQRLRDLIAALVAAGFGHTVPTLLLIVRNANDRETSIRELAWMQKR